MLLLKCVQPQSKGGSGKRSRDSRMTSTLFFLKVISLEDKWNHMLAAVLGRKMEHEEEKKKRKV